MVRFETLTGNRTLYVIDSIRASNLQEDTIIVLCETDRPRTVVLPDYSKFVNVSMKVIVVDGTGTAATNPITIQRYAATDKINGSASVSVNTNWGSAIVTGAAQFRNTNPSTGPNFWICQFGGPGGGGGDTGYVLINYNDFVTNITNNSLTEGQDYVITDFRMVTYIQFTGTGLGFEETHSGAIEPMVVTAISTNEVYTVIKSINYPTDIITWKPIFQDREWDAVLGESTGIITGRTDTMLKLYRDYDWRNIIFRRWETNSGSGVYDSYTDTGFSYQDFTPFVPATSFNTTIKSPLYLGVDVGASYFLDNCVFSGICIENKFSGISFANTFLGEAGYNELYITLGNIFYGDIDNNIIFTSVNNIVYSNLSANRILGFSENILEKVIFNSCGSISDNTLLGLSGIDPSLLRFNNCVEIIGNTAVDPKGVKIMNNNVQQINDNSDFTGIERNVGNSISSNAQCYEITDNNVGQISGNQLLDITFCTGDTIVNNVGDNANTPGSETPNTITNNIVNRIDENVGINVIGDNMGLSISGNNFTNQYIRYCKVIILDGCTIQNDDIDNNNFQASIELKTFTPTAGMSAVTPSITTYDTVDGDVEQVLTSGALSYIPF